MKISKQTGIGTLSLVLLIGAMVMLVPVISAESTGNKSVENIKISVDNPPYLDPTQKPMLSVEILNGNDVGDIVVEDISINDKQKQIVKVDPVKTLQPMGKELKELESIQNKKRNEITKAEFNRGKELRSNIEKSSLRQAFYSIDAETKGLKLGDTLELSVDVTIRVGTEKVVAHKKAKYTLFKFQTPLTNPSDSRKIKVFNVSGNNIKPAGYSQNKGTDGQVSTQDYIQNGVWEVGDTHLHSNHTNDFETGIPIDQIAPALQQMGINWTFITDHSYDIEDFATGAGEDPVDGIDNDSDGLIDEDPVDIFYDGVDIVDNDGDVAEFKQLKAETQQYSSPTFKMIRGEEVSARKSGISDAQHYLGLGINGALDSRSDMWPDWFTARPTPEEAISWIDTFSGLGFIAHPEEGPNHPLEGPWGWDYDGPSLQYVTGVEALNSDYNENDYNGVLYWEDIVRERGYRWSLVGGSDAHNLGDLGLHATVAYIGGLSEPEIMHAVNDGHAYATNGPGLAIWGYDDQTANWRIMGGKHTLYDTDRVLKVFVAYGSDSSIGAINEIKLNLGFIYSGYETNFTIRPSDYGLNPYSDAFIVDINCQCSAGDAPYIWSETVTANNRRAFTNMVVYNLL